MKLKKNLTALCSGCAAGALLLITAPTYADTTLGLWEFEQNSGAIIDSYTPRKNGHLGRWDGEYSSGFLMQSVPDLILACSRLNTKSGSSSGLGSWLLMEKWKTSKKVGT